MRGGEADLIVPVMRVPELLVPTPPDGDGNDTLGTFLEVPCEYGVIDVVHVHFAGRELTRRADGALLAVPERRLLMTLRILEREGGVADVSRLGVLGKVSARWLTKVVGPLLEARGWVRIAGSTWYLRSAVVPGCERRCRRDQSSAMPEEGLAKRVGTRRRLSTLRSPSARRDGRNRRWNVREAGVPLILPNSGVTGWVMMVLGARGLGTEVSWAQRAWLEPAGGPLGQGGARVAGRMTQRQEMLELLIRA